MRAAPSPCAASSSLSARKRSVAPACWSKTCRARSPMALAAESSSRSAKIAGQIFFGGDADGLVGEQILGDGAEVGVVGTHDDGNAKLRRFQRIVPSGGNQAAAHKGHRGQRVDRGQFADGVEQKDFAGVERLERIRPDWSAKRSAAPTGSRIFPAARPPRRTAPDGVAPEPWPVAGRL